MFKGHYLMTRAIVKDFLFIFKFKYNILPLILFYEILEKLRNPFFLMPYRRGANTYFLPIFARREKQYKIAIRWLITSAKVVDLGNKNALVIEKLLYRFEEIILDFSKNSESTSSEGKSEKQEVKITRDESLIEEFNSSMNYKWNVYKNIVKYRNYLHFRWKEY